jgi:putative transposase
MIDRERDLSITRQAEVLKISRGSVYYLPRPVSSADLAIMQRLDRLHLEFPFAGSRMLRGLLAAVGWPVAADGLRRHAEAASRRSADRVTASSLRYPRAGEITVARHGNESPALLRGLAEIRRQGACVSAAS